jgi:hypothetical protein
MITRVFQAGIYNLDITPRRRPSTPLTMLNKTIYTFFSLNRRLTSKALQDRQTFRWDPEKMGKLAMPSSRIVQGTYHTSRTCPAPFPSSPASLIIELHSLYLPAEGILDTKHDAPLILQVDRMVRKEGVCAWCPKRFSKLRRIPQLRAAHISIVIYKGTSLLEIGYLQTRYVGVENWGK